MEPNQRVRITTGLQTFGLTGTVLTTKSYPEHRNRPGQLLVTVELDNGGTKDYDARELEQI